MEEQLLHLAYLKILLYVQDTMSRMSGMSCSKRLRSRFTLYQSFESILRLTPDSDPKSDSITSLQTLFSV